MKFLTTGNTGFIGSAVIRHIIYKLIACCRYIKQRLVAMRVSVTVSAESPPDIFLCARVAISIEGMTYIYRGKL
jgi:nucleoside-diphosphate-sugar epimerase